MDRAPEGEVRLLDAGDAEDLLKLELERAGLVEGEGGGRESQVLRDDLLLLAREQRSDLLVRIRVPEERAGVEVAGSLPAGDEPDLLKLDETLDGRPKLHLRDRVPCPLLEEPPDLVGLANRDRLLGDVCCFHLHDLHERVLPELQLLEEDGGFLLGLQLAVPAGEREVEPFLCPGHRHVAEPPLLLEEEGLLVIAGLEAAGEVVRDHELLPPVIERELVRHHVHDKDGRELLALTLVGGEDLDRIRLRPARDIERDAREKREVREEVREVRLGGDRLVVPGDLEELVEDRDR